MKKTILILIIAIMLLAGCAPNSFDVDGIVQNSVHQATPSPTSNSVESEQADEPDNFEPPLDDCLDHPKSMDALRALLVKSVGTSMLRGDETMGGEMIVEEAAAEDSSEADSAGGAVSQTNVQVEGVDEIDTLKNDGEYLYYAHDNRVYIFDTTESKPALSARLNPRMNHIYGLYLANETLIVIGNSNSYIGFDTPTSRGSYIEETQIKYYNVADRKSPQLITSTEIEGWYQTSRLTNSKLYVIANKYAQVFEDEDMPITPYVNGQPLDLDCIGVLPVDMYNQYMTIASINVRNVEQMNVQSFLGTSGSVYANKQNMYIAATNYYSADEDDQMMTNIHKFSFEGLGLVYKGVGSVTGQPLNQFSMDEYAGNFRIAVTSYDYKNNTTQNNVYILGSDMQTVGKLEGLAEGEQIYSARFQGDRAYLVTFKTVDPLFVLDVSDPSSPKELGYLKIPGYSNYLHVWKDGLVLGIGKDTFERDDMAYYKGIKIALFDVSDVANPVEKNSFYLGDRGTEADALYEHTKLMVNVNDGFIGFSATIHALPDNLKEDERAYGEFVHNGWYIFDISDTKITQRGYVLHNDGIRYEDYIMRAAYTGDTLYTISDYELVASDLETLILQSSLEFR